MSLVTPEYIATLAEAQRAARCVVGWAEPFGRGEAIRVHDYRYVTATGNERACSRCGDFKHYGPRLTRLAPVPR